MKKLEFKIDTDGIFPRSVCNGGVQGDEAATEIVFKIEDGLKTELTKLQEDGYTLQFRIDITDGAGGFIATDALTVDLTAGIPQATYTLGKNISTVGGVANFFLIISALSEGGDLCLDKYSYPCRVRFYPSAATAENAYKETFSGMLADAVKKAAGSVDSAKESADKAEASAAKAAASATSASANAIRAKSGADSAAASATTATAKASAAANSASEAAASAASAAASAASVNPNNYYKKSETYSKTEADNQFAARSSANSADDSSARFSQCLWNKGNDDGTDSYVTVDDAQPANDVYLWSSQKTMSAVEENVTDTINRYKTNEFQYNYAARSSPDSESASSVASAKGLWVKADDTGESGTAELQDSRKASDKVLWSSKKTDSEIKKQSNLLCNALKGSKSGSAVQIDDVSPTNEELKVSVASKNLIPYPSYTSRTSNGITATVNSDGSITLNGTNTGTGNSSFAIASKIGLNKGIYTLSGGYVIESGKYVNTVFDTHKNNKWVKTFGNMGGKGTIIDNSEEIYDDGTLTLIVSSGATVSNLTIKPQLESGASVTDHTPYISDLSAVTVKAYETDPTDIKATYTPNEDGTVEGVTAISPTTTLTTDNSGVVLNCEYNRDINKAFAELQQAIISLGGNI